MKINVWISQVNCENALYLIGFLMRKMNFVLIKITWK